MECENCGGVIHPKRVKAMAHFGEEPALCLKCEREWEMQKRRLFAGIPIIPSLAAAEFIFAVPE